MKHSTQTEFMQVIKDVLTKRAGRVYATPYAFDTTAEDKRAETLEAAQRAATKRHAAQRAAVNDSWGKVPPVDLGAPLYANGEKFD